jgi:hypothetical protein
MVISTHEEQTVSKQRNRSLLLKAKAANRHKPRQSNAAVASIVGKGGIKLHQM